MQSPEKYTDNLDELFRTHYPAAVLYAQKFTNDLGAAKDIAQQVFVNLYEKQNQLQIETSFKAYLFRAVRNTALNRIKKEATHQKHSKAAFSLQEQVTSNASSLEYQELVKKIDTLIQTLPPRCQQVFKMNRFDGKKNKEIAVELGISIRTVETQISYALKALRAKLPKELLFFLFYLKIVYVFLL